MSAVRLFLEEEEPRPGSCLSEKDDEQDVPRTHEESWEGTRNRPEPTGVRLCVIVTGKWQTHRSEQAKNRHSSSLISFLDESLLR